MTTADQLTENDAENGPTETDPLRGRNSKLPTVFSMNDDVKPSLKEKEEVQDDGHMTSLHPTSYLETLIHLLKGNTGSGMFAMGDAYKKGGLLLSPVLTLFLGVVCVHANHLLVSTSKEMEIRLKRTKPPNFADTVELTFTTGPPRIHKYAPYFRGLVTVSLCVTQMGFCSVYFVFVADTLRQVLEHYDIHFSIIMYMLMILAPITLTCWISDLKFLVPLSLLANVLMAFGICTTLVLMSYDLSLDSFYDRDFVGSMSTIPLFLGTAIYAFEGISLVLPLQQQMQKPKLFARPLGVLNVGMGIVTILLMFMGSIGYLKYGDEVKGTLTLNLPEDKIISQCVQIAIACGVLLTYALQMHVPVIIIWPAINKRWGPFKHPRISETIVRTLLVLVTFCAAALVPHLELVIALVGSIASSSLALLIPAILEVACKWESGISYLTIAKDFFIFSLGIFAFATGTYFSSIEIFRAMQADGYF